MKVIWNPAPGECLAERHAVTIGVFDGVHLGHRFVIEQTRRLADSLDARLAVVTFDPHPAQVVRPQSAPRILTGIEHRLELLDLLGVDTTVVIGFDVAQAQERASDFVERVMVKCLEVSAVSVGADFHFGYRREGNIELARRPRQPVRFRGSGAAGGRPRRMTRPRRSLRPRSVGLWPWVTWSGPPRCWAGITR